MADLRRAVATWAGRSLRVRTFAAVAGLAGDDDWDPAAASFLVDALAAAVPSSMLAERLAARAPCLALDDALAAAESAVAASPHAFPPASEALPAGIGPLWWRERLGAAARRRAAVPSNLG